MLVLVIFENTDELGRPWWAITEKRHCTGIIEPGHVISILYEDGIYWNAEVIALSNSKCDLEQIAEEKIGADPRFVAEKIKLDFIIYSH